MRNHTWGWVMLLVVLGAGPAFAAGEAGYYIRAGEAAMAAKDYDRAILCFRTALRYETNPAVEEALATAYNNQALVVGETDTELAIAFLAEANRLAPANHTVNENLAGYYNRKGVGLAEAGKSAEALPFFEKAAQLQPENQTFRRNAAVILVQFGNEAFTNRRFVEARQFLAQALSLDPASVNGLVITGQIAYSEQDLATALTLWKKALGLRPDFPGLAAQIAKAEQENQVEASFADLTSFHFEIRFEGAQRRYDVYNVLTDLEEAYDLIGAEFSRFSDHKITVLISSRENYQTLTGSPTWTGAIYDGKIRVPIDNVLGDRGTLRAILRHEYTHVMVHEVTGGNCPTWLNEGLAQYEEYRGGATPSLANLKEAMAGNRLLPFEQLTGSFMGMDAPTAKLAYEQSFVMADCLIRRYGFWSINRILDKLKQQMPMEQILREEFQLTPDKFTTLWRGHFVANYNR